MVMRYDGGGDTTNNSNPQKPYNPNLPDGGVGFDPNASGGNSGGGTGPGVVDPQNPTSTANKEIFAFYLKRFLQFDVSDADAQLIIDEFWNAYDTKYKNEVIDPEDFVDIVAGSNDTPTFNRLYKTYLDIRKRGLEDNTGISSIQDFNNARREYRQLFKLYGLDDMATIENADKFLANNISLDEANTRMSAAYQAIETADTYLRSQLGELNLSKSELAKALLLGKDGAIELQQKLATANIRAAEAQAGIRSTFDTEQLAKQGLTREQVFRGLTETKSQLSVLEEEAKRSGIDTSGLQRELESELIQGGPASQRRGRIQQRAASRFRGTSGTSGNVSLGRSSAGAI